MLSKEMYLKTCAQIIHSIPHESFWPEFAAGEITECLPPQIKRRIGRPKKARRREEGEAPAVGFKRSSTLRYGRCFEFGHNKRTCAGGAVKKRKRGSAKAVVQDEGQCNGAGTQQSGICTDAAVNSAAGPVRKRKRGSTKTTKQNVGQGNGLGTQESGVCADAPVKNAAAEGNSKLSNQKNVGDRTLNHVFGSSRAFSLLGTELCKTVLDKPDRRPRNVRNTKPRAHPKSTTNGASLDRELADWANLDREPIDWANLDINSAGLGGATNCGIQ